MLDNGSPKNHYLRGKSNNIKNRGLSEIISIMNKCKLINHYNLNSLLGMSYKALFLFFYHSITKTDIYI